MIKKRVYILVSHPLLARGIESLLRQEATLEIVGQTTDPEEAVEQIKALQPDVLVVDREGCDTACTLKMLRLLNEDISPCVIGLELNKNGLWIYREEQRTVSQVRDLLEAIQS